MVAVNGSPPPRPGGQPNVIKPAPLPVGEPMAAPQPAGTQPPRTSNRRRAKPPRGGRPSQQTGDHPNIHWRSLTDEELRAHPRFIALPPVRQLKMAGPSTFQWVRQDEPLWDDLHEGVITSRHLLGILGFREARSARVLGLGKGLVDAGAVRRTYQQLCAADVAGAVWAGPGCGLARPPPEAEAEAYSVNEELRATLHAMRLAHEQPWPPPRRARPRRPARGATPPSISAVRCAWGSAQEAAAIGALLQAMPAAQIEEVGLAVLDFAALPTAELRAAAEEGRVPVLGASPDAMLRPAEGAALESVEVKNVCPFYQAPSTSPRGSPRRRDGSVATAGTGAGLPASARLRVWPRALSAAERTRLPWYEVRGPAEAVPVQYVPQVMLEMLCTRTHASRLVSCSACQGLNVFRIARDDDYLGEMIHFITNFYAFVQRGEEPGPELHWRGPDAARYERFLERTRALSAECPISQHVATPWRRGGEDNFFLG